MRFSSIFLITFWIILIERPGDNGVNFICCFELLTCFSLNCTEQLGRLRIANFYIGCKKDEKMCCHFNVRKALYYDYIWKAVRCYCHLLEMQYFEWTFIIIKKEMILYLSEYIIKYVVRIRKHKRLSIYT